MQKNVCITTIATHHGGAQRSVFEMCAYLKKFSNYSPIVLVPSNQGSLIDELKKENVSLYHLSLPLFFKKTSRTTPILSFIYLLLSTPGIFIYLIRLKLFIQHHKIDILHTNSLKMQLLTSFNFKTKIVWHLRDILNDGLLKTLFLRLSLKKNIYLIANSQATKKSFPTKKFCSVIYNAVADISPSGRLGFLRREFSLNESTFIIGHIGSFSSWKGQIEALKSFYEFSKTDNNSAMFFVGDCLYDNKNDLHYKESLKNLVNELNLSDRVFFVGFQLNANEYLQEFDVLIHSSIKPEPFGRVILEAYVNKVVVIASTLGGALEIVEDQKSGFLVHPTQHHKTALILRELRDHRTKRKTININAYQLYQKKFSQKVIYDQVIEFYKRVCS